MKTLLQIDAKTKKVACMLILVAVTLISSPRADPGLHFWFILGALVLLGLAFLHISVVEDSNTNLPIHLIVMTIFGLITLYGGAWAWLFGTTGVAILIGVELKQES